MKHGRILLGLLAATFAGHAGVIGVNSPVAAMDFIDWCQYGCSGEFIGSGAAWVSHNGLTGSIGNSGYGGSINSGEFNYSAASPTTFPIGMGAMYNYGFEDEYFYGPGASETADIFLFFNTPVYGAGAYIDPDTQELGAGPFTATVTLIDTSFNTLGSYTVNGNSTATPGTAMFLGALDASGAQDVGAIDFHVENGFGNDYSIGTVDVLAPEPGTWLAAAGGLLALFRLRRR